jgi:hypothetical protein
MSEYVLRQAKVATDDTKARDAFEVGMILYGYCCGHFGKDSYGDKKILEIIGNYLEVREEDGSIKCASVDSWAALLESSNSELELREKYDSK